MLIYQGRKCKHFLNLNINTKNLKILRLLPPPLPSPPSNKKKKEKKEQQPNKEAQTHKQFIQSSVTQ